MSESQESAVPRGQGGSEAIAGRGWCVMTEPRPPARWPSLAGEGLRALHPSTTAGGTPPALAAPVTSGSG